MRALYTIATAALLAASASAQAQSVEDFYKGKTIRISVGTSPGGVNDISARLVGRYLGKYIPGHPGINVQNQPGAGGIVGANRIAHTAEKDGTEIAIMERGVPQFAIAGDANAKFDPMTLTWIGSLSSYGDDAYMFLINAKHPAQKAADLRKADISVTMGSNRAGSTNVTFAVLAREYLGMNVKVITGYGGASKIALAMQSGEVDGQVIGFASFQAGQRAMWDAKAVRPLFVFGRATRHPALPDVPTGREIAPNEAARKLIEFAELPFFMALPFVAPPGIPAERADAMRKAFMAMTKDKDMLAEANKLRLDISPIDHGQILKLLAEAKATPKEVIDDFRRLMTAKK